MIQFFKDTKTIVTVIYLCFMLILLGLVVHFDKIHDYSKTQNENAKKFGVSFMTLNNPFFDVINDSIRARVEANGDIIITRDPALDSNRQIEQIREMIDANVDAIFVSPVDYDKIIPVIEEAREKGIIIIFVDTEVYDEEIADGIVVSDNYAAGRICAEYLMNQKSEAKILILEHNRAKSANDRVEGFMDAVEGQPNFEIVARKSAEGQLEIAMPITSNLISNGVEFDTVFAINDLCALGAMAALEDRGKLSEVSVLGVDGEPESKAMIKENLMMATAAQYPSQIGDYAVDQLYRIINGEAYSKKILVDVDLITKDNVDKFGINSWQ